MNDEISLLLRAEFRRQNRSLLAAVVTSVLLALLPPLWLTFAKQSETLNEISTSIFDFSASRVLQGDLVTLQGALVIGFENLVTGSSCGCEVTLSLDGIAIARLGPKSMALSLSERRERILPNGQHLVLVSRMSLQRMAVAAFFSLIIVLAILVLFVVVNRRSDSRASASLARLAAWEVDSATSKAIALTTQALAHDVRRLFSLFKAIIQTVEMTDDVHESREFMRAALPEVNQAMASVEGMIQDVMQIGSDTEPLKEDTAPESLIEAALGELFRIYPDADIAIEYALRHSRMVAVDTVRVGRVFSNILGNSVQAMGAMGKLWVNTSQEDGFVEFTLGNAGSFIRAENLSKLFDAFFTSDKKGGTGLGLAIAKKIVELHGGAIQCRSEKLEKYPSGFVEFVFTLPASNVAALARTQALPSSSKEIQAALAKVRAEASGKGEIEAREVELEREIQVRLQANASKMDILIVDDESVYRNSLLALVEKSATLSSLVQVTLATNDNEALAAARTRTPALVIQDVDLGPMSANGIEVVKALRVQGFVGQICIHSNRFLFEENKIAMEAGANIVLPKPMGRTHFLKLILASLTPRSTPEIPDLAFLRTNVEEAKATLPKHRPTFAYVDDTTAFLVVMKMKVKDHALVHTFRSTSKFFAKVEAEPGFLASLDFLVTDYYFGVGDLYNGLTFARVLRERGFVRPILLASGAEFTEGEIGMDVDGRVNKSVENWSELAPWVESPSRA